MGRTGVLIAWLGAIAAGACSAFGAASDPPAPNTDAGHLPQADASGVPEGAAPADGAAPGGLDCVGALVCDDFERGTVGDSEHPWMQNMGTGGTIGIVDGALEAVLPVSTTLGIGPQAFVVQTPPGPIPIGDLVATVDLDLEIVARGIAESGSTNIMSIDFDADDASFTIYLDGAANVQLEMKMGSNPSQTKSSAFLKLNADKHHVRLKGTFGTEPLFETFIDGTSTGSAATFDGRTIINPQLRVELGARDVNVRGMNDIRIDNIVVRVDKAE